MVQVGCYLKEDGIITNFIAMNGHKDKSKMLLKFITHGSIKILVSVV